MFVFQGPHTVGNWRWRNAFEGKWYSWVGNVMDFAVAVWMARFNPLRLRYVQVARFDYADFYDCRSRLSYVIYRHLRHFREHKKCGVPTWAIPEPVDTWGVGRTRGDVFLTTSSEADLKVGEQIYNQVLDDIIYAFWAMSDAKNDEGKTHWDVTGVFVEEDPRVQRGLDLFAKHLSSLWD